jgi:hypothetical protein
MAEKKGSAKDSEGEVMTAIAAFEQILEAMPGDKASLEALSHAYEQIGDLSRARDYLIRLGTATADENDAAGAKQVVDRIRSFADEEPSIAALVTRLDELVEKSAGGAAASPVEVEAGQSARKGAVRSSFNMADELSFAWNLMEANELTQEEYSVVVQDLTEMSAGDSKTTVSVLHALDAKSFKGIDRVLGFIAKECDAPIVSLDAFDFQHADISSLPMEFVISRGAFIFESLAQHALCVVMNPYDKQLRKDVESACGRKCHFFVCLPADFDRSAEKAKEMIADQAERELA